MSAACESTLAIQAPTPRRALCVTSEWCRGYRHDPIAVQHAALSRQIRGHCAYCWISGKARSLAVFQHMVLQIWRKWLRRRSNTARQVGGGGISSSSAILYRRPALFLRLIVLKRARDSRSRMRNVSHVRSCGRPGRAISFVHPRHLVHPRHSTAPVTAPLHRGHRYHVQTPIERSPWQAEQRCPSASAPFQTDQDHYEEDTSGTVPQLLDWTSRSVGDCCFGGISMCAAMDCGRRAAGTKWPSRRLALLGSGRSRRQPGTHGCGRYVHGRGRCACLGNRGLR